MFADFKLSISWNGQTHSNNSSATDDELFECVWPFYEVDNLKLANIYLFKVSNKNTRKRFEVCSKFTIKTPERRHWRRSRVFIFNFENTVECWKSLK